MGRNDDHISPEDEDAAPADAVKADQSLQALHVNTLGTTVPGTELFLFVQ